MSHIIATVGQRSGGGEADSSVEKGLVFFTLSNLANSQVGARVRAFRKLAGMSQDDLANKASEHLLPENRLGQSDISRLETHPGKARLATFVAVCKALSLTLSDLLEESPELLVQRQKTPGK